MYSNAHACNVWLKVAWTFTVLLILANPVFSQDTPAVAEEAPAENPFPGRFPAPSLDGGSEWLNCSGEISLKDLRGKIVLLDFWTYCCINCIHVLPDLKFLEQKYPNELVVIGVHSAKFDNEKESENIRQAIMRYEIEHPVVNDSNMTIARKFFFNSWPTFVLIDPEGNYVGRQPGEGNRELFDRVIGQMVAYHKAKGTLDETPVRFDLERAKADPTPLRYPGKLLADVASNRLFISDSNHNRIVISSLDGELIDVIGTGSIGAKDGKYGEATFDHPQGMALVGDTLYVADTENHLIREIDLVKKEVSTLAGTGVQARTRSTGGPLRETALNSPWALLAKDGVLHIAMAGPHQMWKHELGSTVVELSYGNGREDIIDGTRDTCSLAQPSGVTTDGKNLYIVDSEGSAVRKLELTPEGNVTTVVGPHDLPRGRSLFEFGDIDGAGDEVRMQHPIGLTYHNGGLYVTDTYNDKIKYVDLKKQTAETWLGTGERGNSLDPVQMNEPAGIVGAGDWLFIADTNNHRILKVDVKTKQTSEFIVKGLQPPQKSSSSASNEYQGPSVTLTEAQTIGGEQVKVEVSFEFPEGYKLNKLAPVAYKVSTDSNLVSADALGKRQRADKQETTASFAVPLSGEEGQGSLTVQISYQFCRDGTGGLCKFGTQQWVIPIVVASDGPSNLKLTAKPVQ